MKMTAEHENQDLYKKVVKYIYKMTAYYNLTWEIAFQSVLVLYASINSFSNDQFRNRLWMHAILAIKSMHTKNVFTSNSL